MVRVAQVANAIHIENSASYVGTSAESTNFDTILLFVLLQFALEVLVIEITVLSHRDQLNPGTSLTPRQQV